MKTKSKKNWKLRIGISFILMVLIASLTSTLWVPNDPYFMETYRSLPKPDGSFEYSNPPYPMSEMNWVSSDMFGRDIFSRLVIGAKMTLAIVLLLTIGKMLLSIPMGMLAGGGKNKLLNKLTEYWAFVFSGFPTLIAAVFIFSMPIFSQFSFWTRILVMSAIIVLMEWARISLIIKGRTEQIMKEPYIEGAKVLGRSHAGLLRVHVWRMILPDVIVLFVFECARSLMLLGQMAMLGVYFLDTIRIDNDPAPPVLTSLTPEWGTMLGESRVFIFSNPLITFIIAGTIVITTIVLNVIGEGLKDKYLFPVPKRSRSIASVLTWKRPLWQRVAIGAVALCVGIGGLLLPKLTTTEAVGAYSDLEAGLKGMDQRFIGYEQAEEAVGMIATEWERIGLQPVHESFISEKQYAIKRQYRDKASVILNPGGQQQTYDKEENVFQLPDVSVEMGEVTAPLAFVSTEEQDNFSQQLLDGEYDGKIVVLPVTGDNHYYWDSMNEYVKYALIQSDVKGIIYSIAEGQQFYMTLEKRYSVRGNLEFITEDQLRYLPVFVMKNVAAAELAKASTATLAVDLENVTSLNVEAQIGTTYDPSKQSIIFYTYYDEKNNMGLSQQQRDAMLDTAADSVVTLTRLAQMLHAKKDRADFNYFFLAVDGTQGKHYGFKHWLAEHPDITRAEPFMIQINNKKIEEELEKVGVTLASLTSNISTQAERNMTERSLSVAAWKEGLVPYHAKSSFNVPEPFNSSVKHINFISDQEEILPFTIRFLDNLEREYDILYRSFEGVAIQENKMKEQLKQLGQDVKTEFNDVFKTIFKNLDTEAFLSIQNERNTEFYKEQQRWFDVLKQRELQVEVRALWVSLSTLEEGETKLRITVKDPLRSKSVNYDIVYRVLKTDDGWKLNDVPFEQLQNDNSVIFYLKGEEGSAARMKEMIDKALLFYEEHFNWKPSAPLVVELYNDVETVLATVPAMPYSLPELDKNGIILSDSSIRLLSIAKTEQVIQAIGKLMIKDLTHDNISRMVEEGLVSVISLATDDSGEEWTFDLLLAEEKLIGIMNGFEYKHLQTLMMPTFNQLIEPGYKDNYFYNAGRYFGYYLLKEKGQDSVFQLFGKLRQSSDENLRGSLKEQATYESTKQALQQQYGSIDTLANEFNSFSENLKKLGMKEQKQ